MENQWKRVLGRPRPALRILVVLAGVALVTAPLLALPVMHEYFEPDPKEDLRLGATTTDGTLPAAIETPSGVVGAPHAADGRERTAIYGGNKTPSSADASYHVDRLTTAPARVQYDEPFRPSVLPFKRLYAFDSVRADLSLEVRDRTLHAVAVEGQAAESEDAFFGDFEVDLVQGQAVRIPTVGPGARLLAVHSEPPQLLEILEDSAENWFVRAPLSGRVHVVVQLSLPRAALGPSDEAARHPPSLGLTPALRAAVARVESALGLVDPASDARTLEHLVEHFRGFAASSELPTATQPEELYVELSLSKKGVCRHRAYAFLVTALGLGFDARLVHNEAHAWVEVKGQTHWHRIDLGGAPAEIEETRRSPDVPSHRPPADPFAWPQGSQSGASLAAQSAQSHGQSASWPSALSPSGQRPTSGPPGVAAGAAAGAAGREAPTIDLVLTQARLRRGALLGARGQASRGGKPCSAARVDLLLVTAVGARPLGSVATDPQGRFDGQVLLPLDVPPGDHSVIARLGSGCN